MTRSGDTPLSPSPGRPKGGEDRAEGLIPGPGGVSGQRNRNPAGPLLMVITSCPFRAPRTRLKSPNAYRQSRKERLRRDFGPVCARGPRLLRNAHTARD